MNEPSLIPALRVAVAVTTAVNSLPAQPIPPADLMGDVDPIDVVRALAAALHSTLGVTLGPEGRSVALESIGLAAAEETP